MMMNEKRLIDANVLYSEIEEEYDLYYGEIVTNPRRFAEMVEDAPTVDAVEVVHGRWINTPPYRASNGNYNKAQECSVCHAYFVSSGNTPYSNHPYCCECGAKMDGGNI